MIRHPPRSPLFPYRTLSRSKAHVRCPRSDYNTRGLPAEEFPAPPDVTPTAAFTLPGETLRDMIRHVLFAVSTDETRAILTGVLIQFKGDQIKMVATDTHRLAVRNADRKSVV